MPQRSVYVCGLVWGGRGGCSEATRAVKWKVSKSATRTAATKAFSPWSQRNSTGRNRLLFRGTIGFC